MAAISRRYFQMHFLERKFMNFDYDFIKVCFWGLLTIFQQALVSAQQLSEPMMVYFTDASMRHSALLS